MSRIVFIKKGDDSRALSRGYGIVRRKKMVEVISMCQTCINKVT